MTGTKTTAATFQLANHDCPGCFRLERLPGGARTHWKAPPCHGAHVKRSFQIATVDVAVGWKADLVVVTANLD